MPSIQELLKQACEDHGDVSFRNTYSGRGMYGRQCVGIAGDIGDVYSVIAQVIKDSKENDDFDNVVDTLLIQSNEDSMGMGTIIYWMSLNPIEEENINIELHDAELED